MDALECGAASLGIILQFYGEVIPLAELREACQITDRTAVRDIVQAAQTYGFRAWSTYCDLSALCTSPTLLPAIAFWNKNHFLVVERFEAAHVWLNDPRSGRRCVSLQDFEACFSNLIICIKLDAMPKRARRVAQLNPPGDALVILLKQGVKGEVFAPDAEYRRDFSNVIHRSPRLVVRATCEQDIVHTFQVAQSAGIPVRVRGAGHSCQGQSLCQDGILLVNVADHAEVHWVNQQHVAVTTRSRWGFVKQELNRVGRTMPVVTDNLTTAVGGTLSVGGYGPRSIRYGAQVQQVERLRLILPDGTVVWCSADENRDLFDFSLAGLGQVGCIEQVVIRTIPHQPAARWYQFTHPSLSALADTLSILTDENSPVPDAWMAYSIRNQGILSSYGFYEPSATESTLQQLGALQAQNPLQLGAEYRQIWTPTTYCPSVDYVVEPEVLLEFMQFLDCHLQTMGLFRYLHGVLVLAVRRPDGARWLPFEATSFGKSAVKFLVGLYPVIPGDEKDGLEQMQKFMRLALAKCLELNGRPYLYGSHELDEDTKVRLYGADYGRLHRLRQQLDPENLVNAGIL